MKRSYGKLALALVLSLVAMFLLMYTMLASWDHFYLNLSKFYMAVLMIAFMGLIMLFVMWGMFSNKRWNVAAAVGFVLLALAGVGLVRTELWVGNEQFLKSMIPHHSKAIHVCLEADITDPEIEKLCDGIIKVQREEIARMQELLRNKY